MKADQIREKLGMLLINRLHDLGCNVDDMDTDYVYFHRVDNFTARGATAIADLTKAIDAITL